jgi:short subunit dehydrogenase
VRTSGAGPPDVRACTCKPLTRAQTVSSFLFCPMGPCSSPRSKAGPPSRRIGRSPPARGISVARRSRRSRLQYTSGGPPRAWRGPGPREGPSKSWSIQAWSPRCSPIAARRQTYGGSGRLEGEAAIITGGDSGIGRAVALAFARKGAGFLISYLAEEEPDARETARVVEAVRKAVKMTGDIGEEVQCRRLAAASRETARTTLQIALRFHVRLLSPWQ